MLLIEVLVIVLFVFGAGLDGGLGGIISNIREQDPNQVGWINRSTPLYHSWWSQAAVLLAHIPLGLLPTKPLPQAHLASLFRRAVATE